MDRSRMLGRNIQLDMEKKGISEDVFAVELGYTISELKKLLEGKMIIAKTDLENIAKCLGETFEELTSMRDTEDYEAIFDCMGSFSDEENEDRILNLIDMYIELKERACQL
ncbi:MAG: helix-turn-helix domain-containing protein [Acetatifactor sp.]|nr:helix-turn-helix domain-containing protein [Acetatifactor sp.]